MNNQQLGNTNQPVIDFLAPRFRPLETSRFQRLRLILSKTPTRRHAWARLDGTVDPYSADRIRRDAEHPLPAFKGFTGIATINSVQFDNASGEPRMPSERLTAADACMVAHWKREEPEEVPKQQIEQGEN